MDYKYTLSLIDKWTAPVKSIQSSMGGFGAMTDKTRQQIKRYKTALGDISKFDSMKTKSAELSTALATQRDKVAELRKQLEATTEPSIALVKRFSKQSEKLQDLEYRYGQYRHSIAAVIRKLKDQGINTKDLGDEQKRLERGLDNSTAKIKQQQRALQGWNKTVNGLTDLKTKFTGMAKWSAGFATKGLMAGAGAGGLALAGNQSMGADVRELMETAKAYNVSTEALQTWRLAAKPVGLEADKIGDIFKDVSDKIGDYALTKGGGAKDLFETLKLNVQDFKNLKPDEALLKIGSALEKSKLTHSQKTFLLESFADDATRLLLLLDNNNARLRQARQEAKEFGLILTESQKAGFQKSQQGWSEISKRIDGIKTRTGTLFNDFLLNTGAFEWANEQLGRLNEYAKEAETWFKLKVETGDLGRWIDDMKERLSHFSAKALAAGENIWSVATRIYTAADKVAEFAGGWDKLLIGLTAFTAVGSVLGTIGAIASGITALTAAATALAAPLAAISLPVLGVVAGISAAVAAGWYLYNNWESVVEKIKSWNWADVFRFTAAIPGIGTLIAGGKFLLENWQGIKDWFLSWSWSDLIPEFNWEWPQLSAWTWPVIPGISLASAFLDWVWPTLPDWQWPEIGTFSLSNWFSDWEWPQLSAWTWPVIPGISLAGAFLDWIWPELPDWEWPEIGSFSLSDYFSDWEWPQLSAWTWPVIPGISLASAFLDWVWPKLPDWEWPDIGSFSLSDWFSDWEWPQLSAWTWPVIPGISLAGAFLDWIWPKLPDWEWPDIGSFSLSDYFSDWEWPQLSAWTWPVIPGISLASAFLDWVWPKLPDWEWPDIGSFSLSDWFSDWEWPQLSAWTWPMIPGISLAGAFLDWVWPELPDWQWPEIGSFSLSDWFSDWEWPALPELPDVGGWFSGWFENEQAVVPTLEIPQLPEFKWPDLPPLPELPAFPIPEPIKWAIDLNPINLAIGRADAFKSEWEQVKIWSSIAFPGLSMTISNALQTAPVDAFTASGLSLQERWRLVSGWAQQNFPLLHQAVTAGLSLSPVNSFKAAGQELKAAWNSVINWFAEKFSWLTGMIDRAKSAVAAFDISDVGSGVLETVNRWIGSDEPDNYSRPADNGGLMKPAETIPQKIAAAENNMNVRSTSEVKLKIESAAPVKVQSTRAGKGTNLSVDTGRMMLAP